MKIEIKVPCRKGNHLGKLYINDGNWSYGCIVCGEQFGSCGYKKDDLRDITKEVGSFLPVGCIVIIDEVAK